VLTKASADYLAEIINRCVKLYNYEMLHYATNKITQQTQSRCNHLYTCIKKLVTSKSKNQL